MRGLRCAAVYLALIALMLRALVPVGWMSSPAAAGAGTLMPCPMMDGMRGMLMPPQPAPTPRPAKHQVPASHEGSICPFATTAQPIRTVEPLPIESDPAQFTSTGRATTAFAPEWDHIPRAPPRAA